MCDRGRRPVGCSSSETIKRVKQRKCTKPHKMHKTLYKPHFDNENALPASGATPHEVQVRRTPPAGAAATASGGGGGGEGPGGHGTGAHLTSIVFDQYQYLTSTTLDVTSASARRRRAGAGGGTGWGTSRMARHVLSSFIPVFDQYYTRAAAAAAAAGAAAAVVQGGASRMAGHIFDQYLTSIRPILKQ